MKVIKSLTGFVLYMGLVALAASPAIAHEEESHHGEERRCIEDAALHRPEVEAPLPGAEGAVVVSISESCEFIKVVVHEVANEVALDVTLEREEQVFEMGAVPASEEGPRYLARFNCEGGTLPGGAESVEAFFGFRIVVRNADGDVVLRGEVPTLECEEKDEEHEGEGEGEGDDKGEHEEPETRRGDSELERPEGASESEAHGGIAVWQRGDREKFVLELCGFEPESEVLFFIASGEEAFALVDDLRIDGEGCTRFFRDSGEEQELPLALTLAQLAERRVEIRDGEGNVLLVGRIPVLDVERHEETEKSRGPLTRPENAPNREAEGAVGVWRRGEREKFDLEVGGFAAEVSLLVYIANAEGEFVLVDDMRTGERGGAEIFRMNFEGGELPLGVDSLDELAGRDIEVRNLAGEVVLIGEVPAFRADDDGDVRERETHRDEVTGAKIGVRVLIKASTGREKLSFEMKHLPRGLTVDKRRRGGSGERVSLFIADELGTPTEVGDTRIRRRRTAKMRWNSRRGDTLPLGVTSIRDLAGRAYEVRIGSTVVAEGFVPFF